MNVLFEPEFTPTAPDGLIVPFDPADAVIVYVVVVVNVAEIVWFAVTLLNE